MIVNYSYLRIFIEVCFFIALFVMIVTSILQVRMKCRSLINYKLIEFSSKDLLTLATIADGIAILVTGGMLLYSKEYSYTDHFVLPLENYASYTRWVDNAELLF